MNVDNGSEIERETRWDATKVKVKVKKAGIEMTSTVGCHKRLEPRDWLDGDTWSALVGVCTAFVMWLQVCNYLST